MKRVIVNGTLEENCYFIVRDNVCFIVDPGYEKELIQKYVETNNLKVEGILLTHGHFDHFGAVNCFDVPVYMNELDKNNLEDHYKVGFSKYNVSIDFNLEDIKFEYVKDGDKIKLNNSEIEVIATPGHTVGSTCFKIEDELYSGDTLFRETVGRWDLTTGDKEVLKKSIKKLLNEYSENLKVFPGHGGETSIKHEKLNNPFYLYECVSSN